MYDGIGMGCVLVDKYLFMSTVPLSFFHFTLLSLPQSLIKNTMFRLQLRALEEQKEIGHGLDSNHSIDVCCVADYAATPGSSWDSEGRDYIVNGGLGYREGERLRKNEEKTS